MGLLAELICDCAELAMTVCGHHPHAQGLVGPLREPSAWLIVLAFRVDSVGIQRRALVGVRVSTKGSDRASLGLGLGSELDFGSGLVAALWTA